MLAQNIWGGLGVVFLVAFWWVLSGFFNDLVIASPWQTVSALLALPTTLDFWKNFGVTFFRFVLSLFIGTFFGLLLGLSAGYDRRIKGFLGPLQWVLMTVPPVILVMVSMIWFGMGSLQTVFVSALIIFPIIYAHTVSAIAAIDGALIEMARLYGAQKWYMMRHIYFPALCGSLFAALGLAAGMGIRIVVLAEVLGASNGIGYAFSLARTNIDTPVLFAWILVCLAIGGGINGVLFEPLAKRMLAWKNMG